MLCNMESMGKNADENLSDVSAVEPDWADIEKAYRAGRETLRSIAARHPGINHVAIKRKADKEGWERDLSWKIAERASSLVIRDAVTDVTDNVTNPVTRIDPVTEKQIVEANAEIQANVIRSERKDITRYRGLVTKLFIELEATTDNPELIERLGEIMADADDGKMSDVYRKIVSLPSRVDMAKKLVETLEKLINTERRVFNIVDGDDGTPKTDKQPIFAIQIAGQNVDVKALGWH